MGSLGVVVNSAIIDLHEAADGVMMFSINIMAVLLFLFFFVRESLFTF